MTKLVRVEDLFDNPPEHGRPPAAQLALYKALKGMGDVPFHVLLSAAQDAPVAADDPNVQQRLGSYITRLNRRLKAAKLQVCLGRLRGTYRLEKL